jgi:thiamine-phosphate pyrophosphorylase
MTEGTSARERPPRLIAFSDLTRAPLELFLQRFTALGAGAEPHTISFTLRDYQISTRERLRVGEEIAAVARATAQYFGVCERADLARLLGADALHLPGAGVQAAHARDYLGKSVFVSRACHDLSAPADTDLDALLLSPILAPRKEASPLGFAGLRAARAVLEQRAAKTRLYALGGVTAGAVEGCLSAGAHGIAVIGAALDPDPLPILRALRIARDPLTR